LTYDARSWTEGEEAGSTIQHTNDVTLTEHDGNTTVRLRVTITKIGPKAKLAAFGMKWGYKAQLDKLEKYLAGTS
jgi:carbon monoxide dehydrogenase subunit G